MAKNSSIFLLLLVLFFCYLVNSTKFCYEKSDCGGHGKKCCSNVCLKRNYCDGKCLFDKECDEEYGELCVERQCTCAGSPCLDLYEATTKIICQYDSQCARNETCKDGVCQINEGYQQPLNTAVLVVVATVGLIVFAGSFYLCLRKQKTTRPSLAAKQAQLKAKSRKNSVKSAESNSPSKNCEASQDLERGNVKRHVEFKHFSHKKPPLTSPCSMVELSAIIEEDEVSEAISK